MAKNQERFELACLDGNLKTVRKMITWRSIDPSYGDNRAIYCASQSGHKDIVELLMQDPRVDPSDGDNWAIRMAAFMGYKDVVELLMQDPRVDPSYGDNWAICYATRNGHKEVVELLLTDKRVVEKIDLALKWCEEKGGYELLKDCVDEHKRELKRQEKERRVQEAIEEMSVDCELYF